MLPTAGRISSCYGSRWGVTHFGVDIAAPIGTPIYAATPASVQRAGAATGFGLAVYIRGDDGAVTVYGHVNRYFVSDGERVSAGEQIAEVGNRGQSTGPHLHFEVHPGGAMYGGQVDPVPWLAARGVSIGAAERPPDDRRRPATSGRGRAAGRERSSAARCRRSSIRCRCRTRSQVALQLVTLVAT